MTFGEFKTIRPLIAAVFGGVSAGMAVIAMFRHNASAVVMNLMIDWNFRIDQADAAKA